MQETKELEQINFEEKIVKAKELLEKLSNPQITLSDSIQVYKKASINLCTSRTPQSE